MPLIQSKSKKALKKNIEEEMKANPEDPKKALAIAYSVQRQNKKKKYAHGGKVDDKREVSVKEANIARPDAGFGAIIAKAEGGMVDKSETKLEHAKSIAAAVMARRKRMAKGGMVEDDHSVDIEENGQEEPNYYYERNREVLDENYDSDLMDMAQEHDSNLTGDEEEQLEENDHAESMIDAIRRKMRSRSPIVR